jgi:hypothetical protein
VVQAQTPASAGYALAFDGVDDSVRLAYTSYILAPTWKGTKTISLWLKPDALGKDCLHNTPAFCSLIFGDQPAWWGINQGKLFGQDRIWVWNYDGNYDLVGFDYTGMVGDWIHLALVHANGQWSVYINGTFIGGMPSGATMQPNTGALPVLHLGGLIINSARVFAFDGEIDEVELWNVERSASEISLDRFTPHVGDEAGLAAYYRMSDGAGTALTDDSINNWNGILRNGNPPSVPGNGTSIQWVTSGAFDDQGLASMAQASVPVPGAAAPGTIILSIEGHPDDFPTAAETGVFLPIVQ